MAKIQKCHFYTQYYYVVNLTCDYSGTTRIKLMKLEQIININEFDDNQFQNLRFSQLVLFYSTCPTNYETPCTAAKTLSLHLAKIDVNKCVKNAE